MPIGDIFKAIGLVKEVKKGGTAPGGVAPPPGGVPKAGVPGQKPFDINLYFKAWGIFFQDFFGKKVPYFFKNIGDLLPQTPDWYMGLQTDEKVSYGVLAGGHVLVIVGIVLLIVL
jgi:hypothetical protein